MQPIVTEVRSWTVNNESHLIPTLTPTTKNLELVKNNIKISRATLDKAGRDLVGNIQEGCLHPIVKEIEDEITRLPNMLFLERKLTAALAAIEAKENELIDAVVKADREVQAMEEKFALNPNVYAESFKHSELTAALGKEVRAKLLLSMWRTLHPKE